MQLNLKENDCFGHVDSSINTKTLDSVDKVKPRKQSIKNYNLYLLLIFLSQTFLAKRFQAQSNLIKYLKNIFVK